MPQPHSGGPAGGRESGAARRRRREFIRAHHPDRGGDPDFFIQGIRALDAGPAPDARDPLPRVIIVRRQPWMVRLASATVRRLRHERQPRRVR
jgi:hypothetical protein